MSNKIQESWHERIVRTLPLPRIVPFRCEADFYGASEAISESLGLPQPPISRATWSHGTRFDPLVYPDAFLWNRSEGSPVVLVHRQDEADFLRASGCPETVAVGAPIVYATGPEVPRLADSLLVMPIHSLDYTHQANDETAYFEALDGVRGGFAKVAACVHPSCHRRGMWVRGFEERDIPVFVGAEINDRNGLRRMRALLSSFTHMTTNWLGSHVSYAAYFGCRVSVFGPRPVIRREDYRDDPHYRKNPEWLDSLVKLYEERYYENAYAHLFTTPAEAIDSRDWAAGILGEVNRREPLEIARLLHWGAECGEIEGLEFEERARILGWSSEAERRIPDVLKELQAARKSLAANERQIETLTGSVTKRDERLKKLRGVIDQLREEVAGLQRERDGLRERLSVTNGEAKSLRDELQALKDKPWRAVAAKVQKAIGRK